MIAAVSELLSEVLGAHFPDFPLEDDVHVTLAGVEPAAFKIVVAFAYGGIADIPRNECTFAPNRVEQALKGHS